LFVIYPSQFRLSNQLPLPRPQHCKLIWKQVAGVKCLPWKLTATDFISNNTHVFSCFIDCYINKRKYGALFPTELK
jgi:hypothetical protein